MDAQLRITVPQQKTIGASMQIQAAKDT